MLEHDNAVRAARAKLKGMNLTQQFAYGLEMIAQGFETKPRLLSAISTQIRKCRELKKFVHTQPMTPHSLISEINARLPLNKHSKIAVLFSAEWALHLRVQGYTDITLITDVPCKASQTVAGVIGVEYKHLGEIQDMNFDVVVGNPPYEKGAAFKFMKIVAEVPVVAMIVPAGFMTQSSYASFREDYSSVSGFKKIKLLPVGTFKTHGNKDVLRQTVWFISEKGYKGPIEYSRKGFTATMNTNGTSEPMIHYYGDISKGIWEKAVAYSHRMNVEWWNASSYDSSISCVHFPEKMDADYVDRGNTKRNTIYDNQFGKSSHIGVIAGTVAAPTAEQLKSKRGFIRTSNPDATYAWLGSHLYGVLLSMVATTQDITKSSVGALPHLIIDDFTEEKAYDTLGLTTEEREWLTSLRTTTN
jgi:hypothetical protein